MCVADSVMLTRRYQTVKVMAFTARHIVSVVRRELRCTK